MSAGDSMLPLATATKEYLTMKNSLPRHVAMNMTNQEIRRYFRDAAYQVAMTRKSRNVKTGQIPVTTTDSKTCPKSCPFNSGNGCYAASGPLGMFWRKVDKGQAGDSWGALCDSVESLPDGQLWRHNQAGDLPGDGDRIDAPALAALVSANKGKRGFTYTHYPMTQENRAAIAIANKRGFTINLSGNNLAHADSLVALDIGPVVSVVPESYGRVMGKGKVWAESLADYRARLKTLPQTTPAGARAIVCPATYQDSVNCESCGLCQRQRNTIVTFPAHGTSKAKASAIADS
jgi:hypothetical protein